jgi:hypothetical protein
MILLKVTKKTASGSSFTCFIDGEKVTHSVWINTVKKYVFPPDRPSQASYRVVDQDGILLYHVN